MLAGCLPGAYWVLLGACWVLAGLEEEEEEEEEEEFFIPNVFSI